MNTDVVLIAGPLVRASSWEPTAERLRSLGWRVQVPDVLAPHAIPPAWNAWSDSLITQIASGAGHVLIGHSSASALAADLATKLPTKAVVIVDGDIPPIEGAAYPVRPALRAFIQISPEWMDPCRCGRNGLTVTNTGHRWLASTF